MRLRAAPEASEELDLTTATHKQPLIARRHFASAAVPQNALPRAAQSGFAACLLARPQVREQAININSTTMDSYYYALL